MPEDLSKKEVSIPVEDPKKVGAGSIPPPSRSPLTKGQPHAPEEQHGLFEKVKDKFSAHNAAPGPALHEGVAKAPHEGTKEERRAKAEELNK